MLQLIPMAVTFGVPISWIVMSFFGVSVSWVSFLAEMFLVYMMINHNELFWELWEKWTGEDDE